MHVISKLECADYIRLIEQFNNLETEIITKLSMSQDIVVCKIGKSWLDSQQGQDNLSPLQSMQASSGVY